MPKMPIAGEKGVNVIDMVMFKSDYDRYKDKTEEYDDYKAKVFLLILGQCTLNMRQKIEEDDKEESKKMEEDYDVIALMKPIKKLSYTTTKFWL